MGGYDQWKLAGDPADANDAAGDGHDQGDELVSVCDRCGAPLEDDERRCAECVAAASIERQE